MRCAVTKNKKILIITASIVAVIVIIVIVLICNKDKEEKGNGDLPLGGDNHMEVLEGKILEIENENMIVIEVTETGTNLLDIGEKITLKVGEINVNSDSENDIKHEMQTGDSISTQFWKEDLEIVDGGYYLDLDKIGSTLNIYL